MIAAVILTPNKPEFFVYGVTLASPTTPRSTSSLCSATRAYAHSSTASSTLSRGHSRRSTGCAIGRKDNVVGYDSRAAVILEYMQVGGKRLAMVSSSRICSLVVT